MNIRKILESQFSTPNNLDHLSLKNAQLSGYWQGYSDANNLSKDDRIKGFEIIADWKEKHFKRIWSGLSGEELNEIARKLDNI